MGRLREETRANDGRDALRQERERAQQMAQRPEASRAQLQERLAQAGARATDAASRAHPLEGQAKQQERELLKVIAAKDALAAQSGKGDDAVGELEDQLYEANQTLEEEKERAAALEDEKRALAEQLQQQRQETHHKATALRELQQELDDERAARERADKQLAQALGQG